MPEELIGKARRALPHAEFWQAYGQTEASQVLWSLLAPDQHVPGPGNKNRSAGVPVPGCQISIREPGSGAVMPRWHVGEICAHGDNVMTGYWHRPDLTERTLREGGLHTGDVGYLAPDGYLHVIGRIDEMIITGGENVYPAEAENMLYQHPAVAEAAVVGIPDSRWGQKVHAILVARPGQRLDAETVVSFCRERLGQYKSPRSTEIRDALPKTGAGKIDKHALEERAGIRS